MTDGGVNGYEGDQQYVDMYQYMVEVYGLFGEGTGCLDIHLLMVNVDAQPVGRSRRQAVYRRICMNIAVSFYDSLTRTWWKKDALAENYSSRHRELRRR